MAKNRDKTKSARVRAQRAYVARQRAERSPSIGAIYKAMAVSLYTANRQEWWQTCSQEVRDAVLKMVLEASNRLIAEGYNLKAVKRRFKSVITSSETPKITRSAPTAREQAVLDQIKNDRQAA